MTIVARTDVSSPYKQNAELTESALFINHYCEIGRLLVYEKPERKVNRVAMATFWRTFHHDGKISPAW